MNKKRLFITGIPTSGKTYLGNKLAEAVGGICVSIDNMRVDLVKEEKYKKWVNYYLDKDEYSYYSTTSYDKQWSNLVEQSEGLWPGTLERIVKYKGEKRPVIFEGVSMLPHLVDRDLHIPGIVLIGRSFEEILQRNMRNPRWGDSESLQKMEAKSFFECERPHYTEEADKYGCSVFETPDEAWSSAIKILTV